MDLYLDHNAVNALFIKEPAGNTSAQFLTAIASHATIWFPAGSIEHIYTADSCSTLQPLLSKTSYFTRTGESSARINRDSVAQIDSS